jgi:predicted Zn-dependent peptidase
MASRSYIHTFRLQNGIPVLCMNDVYRESVLINWFVNAGALYDPIERLGLAHFVEHMFFKGTTQYPTPRNLNLSLDQYGAYCNAHTTQERTWYDIHIDSKHWEKGIEVIGQMMFHSLFPEEEIPPEREVVVNEIERDVESPQYVLSQDSSAWVWYGTPYARMIGGFPETVRKITREDCIRFLGQYYQPHRMFLAIIGDLPSKLKAQSAIEKYLNRPSWDKTLLGKAQKELAYLGVAGTSTTSIMDKPDWWPHSIVRSSSSHKSNNTKNHQETGNRVGNPPCCFHQATKDHPLYPGPSIQYIPHNYTEDQVYLQIEFPIAQTNQPKILRAVEWFNAYLTGGMGSALFVELREKRSLVYSVKSSLDAVLQLGVGSFMIKTSTSGDKKRLKDVCHIIRRELKKLTAKPLDAKTVRFYRQMAQGSATIEVADPSQWMWKAADLYFREGQVPKKKEVLLGEEGEWAYCRPAKLHELAQKWFNPETCWVSLVGKKSLGTTPFVKQLAKQLS